MRMLVIGGAGFIGSHLIDNLLALNHSVVCVDDLSRGKLENIRHLEGNSSFKLYKQDVTELNKLAIIFKVEKPDYVFHLAANSDIQASSMNPAIEFKNTYTTTFNVLSCMREYGVKKLFFASTSAVYGDKSDQLLDENTPNLMPISYYGATKLGSEALISAYSYMNDFSVLIFRLPNVIGQRLTHGVIYDFIRKLEKNPKKLEILGDGRQTKQYIYVNDLVKAIIQFMNLEKKGIELYNLGVDSVTSVTRIADILCEELKLTEVEYHFSGGVSGWKGDVPNFRYSLEKIHARGWKAEYESDSAVRMTIRSIIGKVED